MIYQVCLVFLFYLSVQGPVIAVFNTTNVAFLRRTLLENYRAKIRPREVTVIRIAFNILSINELEIRSQTLSVSGFFGVVWEDSRLAWNIDLHKDISFLFFDDTEIWRPAIVVNNAVNDISVIADDDVPYRVSSDGIILWNPPGIYKTNCDIDTTYYPFDSQICSVVVQSWGYNIKELDLVMTKGGVDTQKFQPNGEWCLLDATSERAETTDPGKDTYATVSFVFTLKRRTSYYGLNIILPVIVLSVLSAFVFILPVDSGEKMGYSLTCLLAFAVFFTLISERMPSTSKTTSYMALYLSVVLCCNGLSVLLTILVLSLNFRSEPVPEWLRTFTARVLKPLICTRGCGRKIGAAQISESDKMEDRVPNRPNSEKRPPVVKSNREEGEVTWKDVARCVDAVCFPIYMITIIIVTAVFFAILCANA